MTDASHRAALLGARIRLVCALLAPCALGASVIFSASPYLRTGPLSWSDSFVIDGSIEATDALFLIDSRYIRQLLFYFSEFYGVYLLRCAFL